MFNYFLYGNRLGSEIKLKQLYPIEPQEDWDITIKVAPMPAREQEAERAGKMIYISREHLWFRNQYANYLIKDGKTISVWPYEGVDMQCLHPFILGYCMSMLFWQRRMEAIHCSCVRVKDRALIIAGHSGSGKSTLTTRFIEQGHGLMADDMVILDNTPGPVLAYPAFPQQKLCRDAALRQNYQLDELWYIDEDKDKFAVSRKECFSTVAAPVAVMFCLEQGETECVKIEEITGFSKVLNLHEHLFLSPMFRQDGFMPEDGASCLELARKVPMYRLIRPKDGDSSMEQMEKALERAGAY